MCPSVQFNCGTIWAGWPGWSGKTQSSSVYFKQKNPGLVVWDYLWEMAFFRVPKMEEFPIRAPSSQILTTKTPILWQNVRMSKKPQFFDRMWGCPEVKNFNNKCSKFKKPQFFDRNVRPPVWWRPRLLCLYESPMPSCGWWNKPREVLVFYFLYRVSRLAISVVPSNLFNKIKWCSGLMGLRHRRSFLI